ncbi:MAG: hypothetical protein M1816_007859 [Peltula sp. TS41687]|nr:MAG: hypothetical protein M1816_007859 [Peltula sp. TS41687]
MPDQRDVSPSLGWICTESSLFTMAKVMLDDQSQVSAAMQGLDAVCSGHIGASNVVVIYTSQPDQASDVVAAAQILTESSRGLEILITDLVPGLVSDDVKPGDVIIGRPHTADGGPLKAGSPPHLLRRAVEVLQREVGADGRWLSSKIKVDPATSADVADVTQEQKHHPADHPRLLYRNLGLNIDNCRDMGSGSGMAMTQSVRWLEGVDAALKSLPVDYLIILGVQECEGNEASRRDWGSRVAANVASYSQELIKLATMHDLMKTISDIRGTETVVPPFMDLDVPQFESHRYPLDGKAALLVIVSANKSKERILRNAFSYKAPKGVDVHSVTLPFDSGVGEQPYNQAGSLGAYNRISNALRALPAANYQEMFREKGIGSVIVASIESYIQTDHIARPTDFGVIMLRNATTEQTTACLSQGTTVDPRYVDRARRFGFDGDPNFGRVTVGQVLAAHVPGLDKADWQMVLGGRSRYQLLNEAIEQLEFPWGIGEHTSCG